MSSSKARLTTGDGSIRSYNKNFRVKYLFEASLELGYLQGLREFRAESFCLLL